MTTRTCPDCSVPFVRRSHNHQRCDPCRRIRLRAQSLAGYYRNAGAHRKRRLKLTPEERIARDRKRDREYRRARPEMARENQLKVRYGITLADYRLMLEKQGHKCPFCKQGLPKPGTMWASVDHDHITKRVRGALCAGCNAKLGWFENRRTQVLAYLDG